MEALCCPPSHIWLCTHTKHDDITGVFGVGDPGYYLGPAFIPAGCGFTPTNDRQADSAIPRPRQSREGNASLGKYLGNP